MLQGNFDHSFEMAGSGRGRQLDGYALLRRCLTSLIRYRLLFVCVAAGIFLSGTALVYSLKRSFMATASVVVTVPIADPLDQTQVSAKGLEDDELVTQAALIQSRDVAARVLNELPSPPAQHGGGFGGLLCRHGLRLACHDGIKPESNGASENDAAIDALLASLVVEAQPRSRVIDLSAKASTGDRAAAIANAFVSNYQKLSLDQQRSDLSRNADWLDGRTAALRQRWLEAEKAASAYNAKHDLTNIGGDAPLVDRQITTMASDLDQAQARYAAAHAKTVALRQAIAAGDPRAMIALSQQPLLVGSANALMQAESARAQKVASFGPNHPDIRALDGQVASARAALEAETRQALASITAEEVSAQAEVSQVTHSLEVLRTQYSGQGGAQAEYRTLRQEAESAKGVYEAFLDRAKEFTDRAALLRPPVMFVSHAAVPASPTFPNRKKLELGILVLSLVGGTAAVALRVVLSPSFTDIEELQSFDGLPLLAILPKTRKRKTIRGSIATSGSGFRGVGTAPSQTVEAVRGLIAQLSLSGAKHAGAGQVIAVVSAAPDDGRQELVSHLAMTMRSSGHTVLLIDGESQSGAGNNGLWDLLGGDVTASDVIRPHAETGADVLPADCELLNAIDATDVERLRTLIGDLAKRYSMIVINAPALLMKLDGLVLASLADQAVFVCRWGVTPRDAVGTCIERLMLYGVRLKGLVLTGAETRSTGLFSGVHYMRADTRLLPHPRDFRVQ